MLSVVERRISPIGMITGLLLGCAVGWCVAMSPVASLWTAPVAAGCTLITAVLFPVSEKVLD
jgi:hypothetical protein